jgi:hypothetical protein
MARFQNSIPPWNQGTKKVDPVRPRAMQPVFEEGRVAMSSLLEVRSLSPRSPIISLL